MRTILAHREAIRVFYVNKQHVILVSGSRPTGALIRIVPGSHDSKVPGFRLEVSGPDADDRLESYYLVEPILGPLLREHVSVEHSHGRDIVKVETLTSLSPSRGKGEISTGTSQSFSFEEAFHDALRRLPQTQTGRDYLIQVISLGAVYGGIQGFSRMFVRLEREAIVAKKSVVGPQANAATHPPKRA
jgi:hypothetical protein